MSRRARETTMANVGVIEENGQLVVAAIAPESVAVYAYLADRFAREYEAARDLVFQFLFRSYYRIDNAGLTDEFKRSYFETMQACRGSRAVDLRSVALQLYEIRNRKGQRSLQFSFASKLANLVTGVTPIVDAEVARVFGFVTPSSQWPVDRRLDAYLEFHEWLEVTYARILRSGQLAGARQRFRAIYAEQAAGISDNRVLDFVFWTAGKLGYRLAAWRE